jgi:hypothetical protein
MIPEMSQTKYLGMLHQSLRNYTQSSDGESNETHHFENDPRIHYDSHQDLGVNERHSTGMQTVSNKQRDLAEYKQSSIDVLRDAYRVLKRVQYQYSDGEDYGLAYTYHSYV